MTPAEVTVFVDICLVSAIICLVFMLAIFGHMLIQAFDAIDFLRFEVRVLRDQMGESRMPPEDLYCPPYKEEEHFPENKPLTGEPGEFGDLGEAW
jgi:hypothetical protein